MVKLSEISLDKFRARVVTELHPVTKNLDAITKTVYDKRGSYQVVNAIRMVQTAIQKDTKLENATIKTGILIGCTDKRGSKAPIKAAFLLRNQSHMELLLWDVKVPYGDGIESQLIFPSIMKIAMSPSERGGMTLERVMEYKKLNSAKEVISNIETLKAITTIKGVRTPDRETYNFPVAVLKGTIISAGPIVSSPFEEETKTFFSVWEQTEKKITEGNPALNLKLKGDDGATIWAKINPRRYSKGYYDISDLTTACQDAIKESDDPKAQTEFVSGVLNGKNVIVIGSVTGKDDNPQYGMTVSMNTHAIIEIPDGEEPASGEFEPQQKLEVAPEPQESPIIKEQVNVEPVTEEQPSANTNIDSSPLIDIIKEDMLLRAGIFSKKKRIDEKKKYLAGMKFREDLIDKLKYDDWLVVKAAELHIELTKEIATAIIEQAYEELTKVVA